MLVIDNAETQDDYVQALTLESPYGGRLVYVVANQSARVQYKPVPDDPHAALADWQPPDGMLLTPQSSFIDKISGVRFKTAVAGSPARILAQLSEPGDILPASGTPFTGTLASSGAVVPDAMTAYTPTWTSTVAPNPTIGNGTLSGRYIQIGAFVYAWFFLQIGATTTLGGGGAWLFSLPVAQGGGQGEVMGHGRVFDASASFLAMCSWIPDGRLIMDNAGLGAIAAVGPAVPMAWAPGDNLHSFIAYGSA